MLSHKIIPIIAMLALLIFTTTAVAQESDGLALFVIPPGQPFELERAVAVSFINVYHYGEYPEQFFNPELYPDDYQFMLKDNRGNTLVDIPLAEAVYPFSYDAVENTSSITIVSGSSTLFSQQFTFCNNNGVCEPCTKTNCETSENSLSCNDCASGGEDGYCDGFLDGICDKDCTKGYDIDCFDCGEFCPDDGLPDPLFCVEDFGGEICEEDEVCVGDILVVDSIDANGGTDCCAGDAACIPESASVDVPDEVLGLGYAQDVPSEEELWQMQVEERNAIGAGFDEEFLTEEEQTELHEELYGTVIDDPLLRTDEEWEAITDDTVSYPASESLPPSFIEKLADQASDAIDTLPEESGTVLVSALAAIIILTLILLVGLFIYKSNRQLTKESLSTNLDAEIGKLLKQGYSYEQIRSILLTKGYDVIAINGAIMAHYRRTKV